MRTIRTFEERVSAEFAANHIPGFVHLCVGQEACAVGVCMHLEERDYIGSTHRGHGHCIAKGCDPKGMMLEIFGKVGGLCGGKGGSMHIADLERGMLGANGIVGGGPPLAIGAALSAKTLKNGRVVVSFIGDGASNQGTVFEAMNMAVVLQLPIVFFVENNGYGEFTAASYACGAKDITQRAVGFGMPAATVDGTDFFAVYGAAGAALERARSGEGPSLMQARCTRFYGHYIGDPQAYRSKQELEACRTENDPLLKFRKAVLEQQLLSETELDALDRQVQVEMEAAVQAAREAAPPPVSSLTADVYVSYGGES